MTFVDVAATILIGILAGGLSVLAGGGVTVVLPVLLALGLSADQANATSRLNLTVGAVIATIVLARKKKIEWKATVPLLVATVAGAIVGAFAGTFIHSNAMLTIIVLTSVVSMTLVYVKPNRWLSTGATSPVVPERAGVFIYSLLCFYGGVIAVDSAILRLIVLVLLMGLPSARLIRSRSSPASPCSPCPRRFTAMPERSIGRWRGGSPPAPPSGPTRHRALLRQTRRGSGSIWSCRSASRSKPCCCSPDGWAGSRRHDFPLIGIASRPEGS
jgi:hypothetical protein